MVSNITDFPHLLTPVIILIKSLSLFCIVLRNSFLKIAKSVSLHMKVKYLLNHDLSQLLLTFHFGKPKAINHRFHMIS